MKVFPITIRTLLKMGWFESYTAAAVWLKKAVDEERMPKHVAYLEVPGKNRTYVERLHCVYRIAQRNAFHHYQATRFGMRLWWIAKFNVLGSDREKMPDAEIKIEYPDGDLFADLEIDSGTEGQKQWEEHLEGYIGSTKNLFIVVALKDPSKALDRLETLREWSRSVWDIAYFTTIEAVEDDPHGFHWWHAERTDTGWKWVLENLEDPEP